jgi:hypothetical protein
MEVGEVPRRAEAEGGQSVDVLSGLIENALKERGVPSISIALVRGDAIVWTAAFGYANVRSKTPATPETIYCTGSTFKSATATALMQLQQRAVSGPAALLGAKGHNRIDAQRAPRRHVARQRRNGGEQHCR